MAKINANSIPNRKKTSKIQVATRPFASNKYKNKLNPFLGGVDDKLFKVKYNDQITVLSTNDSINNISAEVIPYPGGNEYSMLSNASSIFTSISTGTTVAAHFAESLILGSYTISVTTLSANTASLASAINSGNTGFSAVSGISGVTVYGISGLGYAENGKDLTFTITGTHATGTTLTTGIFTGGTTYFKNALFEFNKKRHILGNSNQG